MADNNKVEFGISNLIIGTYTDTNGTVTLGTPYHQKGAVSLSLEPEGDSNEFYADNMIYWSGFSDNGFSGSLEVARFDTDAKKDFFGRYAIVFVNNGNCLILKQSVKGRPEVFTPYGIFHIFPGDQQLPHRMAVLGKELIVHKRQFALTHRGAGLLAGHIRGPGTQSQSAHTGTDGTGGHQNHLVPRIFEIGQNHNQIFHGPQIQPAGFMNKGGSTHLKHISFSHGCFSVSFLS